MRNKNGQFGKGQSGNPQGRPRGSKNAVSEDFLADIHEAWKTHGPGALQRMIAEKPSEFVKTVAHLVPRDLHFQQTAVEQPGISVALTPNMSKLAEKFRVHGVEVEDLAKTQ